MQQGIYYLYWYQTHSTYQYRLDWRTSRRHASRNGSVDPRNRAAPRKNTYRMQIPSVPMRPVSGREDKSQRSVSKPEIRRTSGRRTGGVVRGGGSTNDRGAARARGVSGGHPESTALREEERNGGPEDQGDQQRARVQQYDCFSHGAALGPSVGKNFCRKGPGFIDGTRVLGSAVAEEPSREASSLSEGRRDGREDVTADREHRRSAEAERQQQEDEYPRESDGAFVGL